jgi:Flp pilus assembly pilin Flp
MPGRIFQRRPARGAVAIEYALVASLIAIVVIAGFMVLGVSLEAIYAKVAACFVDFKSCTGSPP